MFKKTLDGIAMLLKGIADKIKGKKQETIAKQIQEEDKEVLKSLTTGIQQAKEGKIVDRGVFSEALKYVEEKHRDVIEAIPLSGGLMRMSKKGQQMLTELEGVSTRKYKCSAGVWTVGIGATRTEYPGIGRWPRDKEITIQEAFDKLPQSLEKYERAVRKALTVEVPQHTFDALVSWCYNVGVGWCKKRKGRIRATFIRLLNEGHRPSSKIVRSAFLRFRQPPEIRGRRKKEAKLLTTGVYTLTGKANYYGKISKSGHPSITKRIKIEEYL